jgi:dihydroorotate dehydrogenase
MPDWSYRTFLRPVLLSRGEERGRRAAVRALRTLSRLPLGRQLIDFMGHMRADPRLRTPFGDATLSGPVILGAGIDPAGEAIGALERFGVGMIEIDAAGTDAAEVAANLARAKPSVPVCIRVSTDDAAARLAEHAAFFIVDDMRIRATRPILYAGDAVPEGAAGVWLRDTSAERVRAVREQHPQTLIIAGGVTSPDGARRLLDAGANAVAADAGLLSSGPGLVKRCNEALLSIGPPPPPPEALGLDAARSAWFWALLLGVSMFAGGLLTLAVASTRVVLPYDESMAGLTRAQLHALNPRLLPFMAHDRVSLAGTMISIGIFYAALAWAGIRRGEHWAHVTVIVSATIGFFSFFFFLGFGYFDPFHAFVTAILTQFTLLCMVLPPSPRQVPVAEWGESAAWRRGQWGQLLFILIGVALTGAGALISLIGCTSVFVATDLAFLQTTAAALQQSSFAHLVPLIAHDRASLGGMLLANGVTVWLAAQWGFRAGAGWLWSALAWGGNIAFAAATIVHFVVGYGAILHLTPAFLGWIAWNVALGLTRGWLRATG